MSGDSISALLRSTDPVLDAFAEEVGDRDRVVVVGARTRWTTGGRPADDAREVIAPSGVVSYIPDEMTVTVRAGTSVEALHAELAAAGQRTALPERGGTVGGAIAVGENGLFPLGRGRVRTAVLQVRYVSAEGRLVTGGGPTVKNVTGFDIPRLMTGSLGTLGCLAEFILRTNPIPAVGRWQRSSDADPFAVLDTVLRPSVVLWNGSTTWVQLEGHGPAVESEAQKLATMGTWVDADGPPERPRHRWSLTPDELRNTRQFGEEFVASIGVGTAWAAVPQPPQEENAGVRLISDRLKAQFDPTGRLNPGRSI